MLALARTPWSTQAWMESCRASILAAALAGSRKRVCWTWASSFGVVPKMEKLTRSSPASAQAGICQARIQARRAEELSERSASVRQRARLTRLLEPRTPSAGKEME